jgi:hypothetical protein
MTDDFAYGAATASSIILAVVLSVLLVLWLMDRSKQPRQPRQLSYKDQLEEERLTKPLPPPRELTLYEPSPQPRRAKSSAL